MEFKFSDLEKSLEDLARYGHSISKINSNGLVERINPEDLCDKEKNAKQMIREVIRDIEETQSVCNISCIKQVKK